jgi:hypothetical protein
LTFQTDNKIGALKTTTNILTVQTQKYTKIH